jgi:fatty-acyl-CoA synthase
MNYTVATLADTAKIEAEMDVSKRWEEKTVYEQLCKTAKKFPNRPAVSFQLKSGFKDKATTLNWDNLAKKVTQAANLFRSLGIEQNDVVAYLLPTSHETLITLMGGMTAGIVAPINPTLEPSQIAALLRETGAKVLVTIRAFPKSDVAQLAAEAVLQAPNVKTVVEIDLLPHLSPPLSWIVPLIRPKNPINHSANIIEFNSALSSMRSDELDFKEGQEDHYCAYFHTGGTTGMPKIAQHRHSGVLYNGWLGDAVLYTEKDVLLCPLPLFHVFAAYPIWAGCLVSGAHMVLPTPAGYRGDGVFDDFWKLIERWEATFMVTVPTAASQLLQRPVNADISSLNAAFCGSAPMPVELFKRFQEVTGVEIIEGYGLTEATCLVSCNPKDGLRKVGSIGIPLPYTKVRILDCQENGEIIREMEIDEIGEICISNAGINVGETYTEKAKNAGLYADKVFFRTGDLGRIDEDGYLWITGRAKDLIIRSGHNIDPALIEEALAGHPSIAMAGAIGQPDEKTGEMPCAYVELNAGASVTIEELLEFSNKHVPERAARPKYIEIIDELPKTAVGKIFKPQLRKLAIKRVYDEKLLEDGLDVTVKEVLEDKKLGLTAHLNKATYDIDDMLIKKSLGNFIRPWTWSE